MAVLTPLALSLGRTGPSSESAGDHPLAWPLAHQPRLWVRPASLEQPRPHRASRVFWAPLPCSASQLPYPRGRLRGACGLSGPRGATGGRRRDACRLDAAAWGLVRRERAGSMGQWQSQPWAACGAQPVGRGRPAGSGPRGGSSRASCRGAAPSTGTCQTPRGRTRVSISLARVLCVSPAHHPGNPVWPLNGLRPSGGLAEASQALHSPRAQRPQAAPSDEEAGWARGLAGQTADPLPGHLLGGRGSCSGSQSPSPGGSSPARPKESPWLPPQSHPTPSSPSSAHQECARCRGSKNRS